jgi:hypothetical protein
MFKHIKWSLYGAYKKMQLWILKKSTLHTSLNKSENSKFKIQKHLVKFKWVLVKGIIFYYIPSPYLFPQPQSFLDFIKDQRLYSTSTF